VYFQCRYLRFEHRYRTLRSRVLGLQSREYLHGRLELSRDRLETLEELVDGDDGGGGLNRFLGPSSPSDSRCDMPKLLGSGVRKTKMNNNITADSPTNPIPVYFGN